MIDEGHAWFGFINLNTIINIFEYTVMINILLSIKIIIIYTLIMASIFLQLTDFKFKREAL